MAFNIYDFVIGFLLMNAMPHLIFGILDIRMISLFGLGAKGNLAYSFFNVILATSFYAFEYGWKSYISNEYIIGALTLLFMYALLLKPLHSYFKT